MIIDDIKNLERYYRMVPGLKEAYEFFSNYKNAPSGSYKGEIFTANIQDDELKDISHNNLEAHRKYIDFQIVLEGAEEMGWANIGGQNPSVEYDPEKDFAFYKAETIDMTVKAGTFYICFPTDGHRCKGINSAANYCRKVCVKMPLEVGR